MAPEELRYLPTHEWCRVDGKYLIIGVTEHALRDLGDIVYVELPDVGDDVLREVPFGEIEGSRLFKSLNAHADGQVAETNGRLVSNPELLLKDPYGEGWLIKLEPDPAPVLDNLLTAVDYEELTKRKGGR